MSRFLARIRGYFKSGTQVGIDKAGNRYFTRTEALDGAMKEHRWVIFKGEDDPTSLPVEWICWLSGQRKKAPTPEEVLELEARRERVKLNAAILQKEEERKLKSSNLHTSKEAVKVGAPDLQSFIKQFRDASADQTSGDTPSKESDAVDGLTEILRKSDAIDAEASHPKASSVPKTSEPTGSGATFKPGAWQPPS